MNDFSPVASLTGGILIGLAAALFLLMTGRICGVSGIYGGLLHFKRGDTLWRFMFIAGLITGGGVSLWLFPEVANIQLRHSPTLVIVAGLLVGVGVRLGSGCTSGHGVCGVGRLAPRSLLASALFVAAGIFTATLLGPLLA